MSMSTHIEGIKAPDDKWQKMKAAWDACKNAGVGIPTDVEEFFEFAGPDEAGVVVDLDGHPCAEEWGKASQAGYQIDLSRLPKGLTHIRFYNSY